MPVRALMQPQSGRNRLALTSKVRARILLVAPGEDPDMQRRLTLTSFGLLATLAFMANAAGPHRGGFVSTRPVVGVFPGAPAAIGFVSTRPIIGVFPGAPAAIAPSFPSLIPTTRLRGFRALPWAAGPIYGGPPAYYDSMYPVPPIAYIPPAEPPQVVSAPAPLERDVIQYADGRYELRGDGIATSYRWVWIPNPPPPPKSRPDAPLYTWTDEQGGIHVTDRLNSVPERFRAEAKRNASL